MINTSTKPLAKGYDPLPPVRRLPDPVASAIQAAQVARGAALEAPYAPVFSLRNAWAGFSAEFTAAATPEERIRIAREAERYMRQAAVRQGTIESYRAVYEADRAEAMRENARLAAMHVPPAPPPPAGRDIIAGLARRGLTLHLGDGGRLLVSGRGLTETDKQILKANREAVARELAAQTFEVA